MKHKAHAGVTSIVSEFIALTLISLLFLSIGSDSNDHVGLRMVVCGLLFIPLAIRIRRDFSLQGWTPLLMILMASIIGFQIARYLVFLIPGFGGEQHEGLSIHFLESMKRWACYGIAFLSGYCIYIRKNAVNRLLTAMAWVGFFIAINTIPALLLTGKTHYYLDEKSTVYFYPSFYFHDIVSQYILGTFGHVNQVGDIMAVGFFPSLALAYYSIRRFQERKREQPLEFKGERVQKALAFILMNVFIAFIIIAAVFLLFSRGTIVSFAFGLGIFFAALFTKFPSKKQWGIGVLFLVGSFGFLIWTNDVGALWKEVASLEKEMDADQVKKGGTSLSTNLAGVQTALRINRDHPVWGVGTHGYKKISKKYMDPKSWETSALARWQAMCHYVHLLAEEGIAAYLYYLFLMLYLFVVVSGLASTQSYYKFICALSLLAPTMTILLHASFNHLMQRFSTSMLVYMVMGATLGILRKDFDHHG